MSKMPAFGASDVELKQYGLSADKLKYFKSQIHYTDEHIFYITYNMSRISTISKIFLIYELLKQ